MSRILVVDDEEDVRHSIRFALESAGYDVFEAQNGLEADERLAENVFDVVITDMIMPEKEGFELIRDIKQNYPDVKIVAITGGGSKKNLKGDIIMGKDDILEFVNKFGADDTLQKPFKLAELLDSVENCLSDKKLK